MEEKIKALYTQEINQSRLNFDRDPEYQTYYTQAEELWEEGDIPPSIFHLLERSDFLSFACGLRLGLELAEWVREG